MPKSSTVTRVAAPHRGLDSFFQITQRGSTVGREIRGGLVTFFTMAYIVVLNPLIIGTQADSTGLGLNAFVTFGVAQLPKMTWADAMGLVVLEGIIITVLVLTGFRQAVFKAVRAQIKAAITAGIGL